MKCPFCGSDDTQVKDSRPTEDNTAIRRRRSCTACGARFTTFERVQLRELSILKAGGRREVLEDPLDPTSEVVGVEYKPIEFYISTWGGDAAEMFSVYDTMRMVRESCEICPGKVDVSVGNLDCVVRSVCSDGGGGGTVTCIPSSLQCILTPKS